MPNQFPTHPSYTGLRERFLRAAQATGASLYRYEHPVHAYLRADHWLHLQGDPYDATGAPIKRGLLEQFYPADSDWQELVWLRTRQIWERR